MLLPLLCLFAGAAACAAQADDGRAWLRAGIDAACAGPYPSDAALAAAVPSARWLPGERLPGPADGRQVLLALPGGDRLKIQYRETVRGRQLLAELHQAHRDGHRPLAMAIADTHCRITLARRIEHRGAWVELHHLDARLADSGVREWLEAPLPELAAADGAVVVAMVDSGVNYRLPAIADGLARSADGTLVGYDYWDMDPRPFDADPSRSPFVPRRHGTRTASVVLHEAPGARVAPYRYPRADMSRMTALVEDIDAHGIRIVNLSLGSNRREDWAAFAEAARQRPHMLFIVSAGNDGRDIDAEPVYPAALPLANVLSVTAATDSGALLDDANYGARSVDLLVPAVALPAIDFDGGPAAVSGSSHAAARVSALAARLLARQPALDAAALRAAIVERALPVAPGIAAVGLLPRPHLAEHIPPISRADTVVERERHRFDSPTAGASALISPVFALFSDTAWRVEAVRRAVETAAGILARCGIGLPVIDIRVLDGGDRYRYFRDDVAGGLFRHLPLPRPAVFFVRHTLQDEPFEAEAIGRANSTRRPALRDTVWIIEEARDAGIVIAHELVHLLLDNGDHVETPGNLMRARTTPRNTRLEAGQCAAMREGGRQRGLLTSAATR